MKSFFNAFNLFPHKLNFNFKRNQNFHTIIGLFFSILVYIGLFFCLYKFSEECLQKRNPKLSIKEKLFTDDVKINFTNILDSINYKFNLSLETNNPNEDLIEAIRNYFNMNFYIYDYDSLEELHFYYNDFQNFEIISLNYNYTSNNTFINFTQEDKNKFKYKYLINFNASINKNTSFKCKFLTENLLNSTNLSKFIFNQNNNKIDLQDLNKLSIKFEDIIIKVNRVFSVYTTYNESKTSNLKIELNDKIGYFNSHDSIIDPEIRIFAVKELEKFQFYREGWFYSYQLIELIEDTDWLFSNYEKKYITQINSSSGIPLTDLYKDYLDIFSFNLSKKVKSQTRIYKKIQNVLAEIGGIFSILTVIGNVILNNINQTTFEINVINNLFSNTKNIDNFKKVAKCLPNNNNESNLHSNIFSRINKNQNFKEPKFKFTNDYKTKIKINNNIINIITLNLSSYVQLEMKWNILLENYYNKIQ